jgi:hypothetical protein
MPHKLLCLSPENNEDLAAALAHEPKLTPHDTQQGTNWIGYPEATRGQLWLFSRDQLLSIFYISRNKNTVFVSIPEDHLLYDVLVSLQDKLKAINPDIKDILREPNDANNPKFIVLHTEYTHEGGKKKGAKDDTKKKGGWNSADKKNLTKDEALANSPVVLEQWIINVQKVTAHDVHGLTPFLKLEKAFIKLPDGSGSGSGGDATQSMLDAID